jgi:glycosyltransferase involved in cell wall biosynthesis
MLGNSFLAIASNFLEVIMKSVVSNSSNGQYSNTLADPRKPLKSLSSKRLLVIAPQPFYSDRGTPIATSLVLQALSQIGYLVDIITYPIGQSLVIPDVNYYRVTNPLRIQSVPIGFSIRKLWLDAFIFFKFVRMIRRQSYFCIYAIEELAFLALPVARLCCIPFIYDMQSSIPEQLNSHFVFGNPIINTLLKTWERCLLKQVDCILCSAGLAKQVKSATSNACVEEWLYPCTLPAPDPKVMDQIRKKFNIRNHNKVVIYTGTFEDYQGLKILAKAIPFVFARMPETIFLLVGKEKSSIFPLTRQISRRVPDKAYRIISRQPRDIISNFLAISDIAVSPRTCGHNFPLKVFDYMAAGCPIVATSIPAHSAILDEKVAVLSEPTSLSFATAIINLLEDPCRAFKLKNSALSYAENNLKWSNFVKFVAKIFRRLDKIE